MSPAQLASIVSQEQSRLANGGGAPQEQRRLDTLQTVLSDVSTRSKTDPIGLAARSGAFIPTPVPVNDPHSAEFSNALAARDGQAVAAAQAYDGNLVPLRPQEASALQNYWNQAGPSDRLALAAQFSAHMRPDVAQAALKQVAGNDTLALTAGRLAQSSPEVAAKIVQGSALLESPGVKPKVNDVRAALGDVAKGELYASPTMNNQAIEAGLAVYAANRAQSGALFDPADRNGIENALQEVTGKVVNINGLRTPIPPGMAAGVATRGLANLKPEDLASEGGLQPGLDVSHLAQYGQLHALSIGGSQYAVTIGGRPVMNASGARPLVVDLARIGAHQAARAQFNFEGPAQAQGAIAPHQPVAVPASQGEADIAGTLPPVGKQRP